MSRQERVGAWQAHRGGGVEWGDRAKTDDGLLTTGCCQSCWRFPQTLLMGCYRTGGRWEARATSDRRGPTATKACLRPPKPASWPLCQAWCCLLAACSLTNSARCRSRPDYLCEINPRIAGQLGRPGHAHRLRNKFIEVARWALSLLGVRLRRPTPARPHERSHASVRPARLQRCACRGALAGREVRTRMAQPHSHEKRKEG